METRDLITVDPEILGGTPVFKGTRVLVKTLFEYLEDNYSLEEFLGCFPSVTLELACKVLADPKPHFSPQPQHENSARRMRAVADAYVAGWS